MFLNRIYAKYTLLCWFVGFIVLPVAVGLFYGYSVLSTSLPQSRGVVQSEHVTVPVKLSRSQQGVVDIKASTDRDAFFAMGYAHAQDRLWQLEIQRRMASGQLSEIFGKSALQFDIFIRTLGIYKAAESSWNVQSDEAQDSLRAYSEGVNAWLASVPTLPSEFIILNVSPQPWKPVDSLAWIKLFALNMGSNFQAELDNYLLAGILTPEQLKSFNVLLDANPETEADPQDVHLNSLALLSEFGAALQQEWKIGGSVVGSNAWVVSGAHTDNQKAMLANDPHLALDLPSLWYPVKIKGEKLDVSGMSLVGLPLVLLGRNQNIAWGATNMMADTQDLFFERLSTNDPELYQQAGQWKKMTISEEYIQVKADFPALLREPLAPVKVTIRRTENGPVITDLFGEIEYPMSLRWVGNSDVDTSYDAFLALNYAHDWHTFKQAMAGLNAPAMNMLYIDADNNIGHLAAGKVPVRQEGEGLFPLNGWLESSQWQGFIPTEEMPQEFNPERGYFINANNKITSADSPHFISHSWAEPARSERINQLISEKLASGEKLSVADSMVIQLDLVDRQALKLLPHLANLKSTEPHLVKMLEEIRQWDGRADKDSSAAVVFYTWVHYMRTQLFADKLSSGWNKKNLNSRLGYIVKNTSMSQVLNALESKSVDWCDNTKTPVVEDCEQIKLNALRTSFEDISQLLGENAEDWRWSDVHHVLFDHQPFSNIKGLDFLYERRVPHVGSPNSINLSNASFDRKQGFTQSYGAGFRQIMQVGTTAPVHMYINSTGQSGNALSRYYDDMVEPYINGEYFRMSDDISDNKHELELLPEATRENK
ncbi:MAG: penicillin acylase family protein [Gammaproteobacteria bacterium]|nr:penicillin acylase family protein [Gammaproteobacteria bacterium]MBU2056890.1 penicillin acylase family protein [Gammaproteobacteria bacterium]MBU2174578.1 penicillin acylase family protein [Gammaproteobacteria bacterium]MBU2248270.1 penicillin acylase family protein [Gammaproteobacteria bacterium]MBU2343725.1 penicillin acylase family protein [Gammaproteobacteria bacterium]